MGVFKTQVDKLIRSLQVFLFFNVFKIVIKNVNSSSSHKKTPSLREFKKILPNTFIYESILIKIYMNTNIMNTQIFH